MRRYLPLACLLAAFWSAAPLSAREVRFAIGIGVTEIDKIQQQGVASMELVFPPLWRSLHPIAGFHVSEEGDTYLSAGAMYEWSLGKRWWGNFGLAAGYFHYDGGYQLGGPLEFQSRITLERSWRSGIRAGCSYQHLSHGGFYDNNPGSERLLLHLSFPFE